MKDGGAQKVQWLSGWAGVTIQPRSAKGDVEGWRNRRIRYWPGWKMTIGTSIRPRSMTVVLSTSCCFRSPLMTTETGSPVSSGGLHVWCRSRINELTGAWKTSSFPCVERSLRSLLAPCHFLKVKRK